MVGQAVGAILAGEASTVLVYRSLNGRSGRRFGQAALPAQTGGDGSLNEFFAPHGLVAPGQCWSLMAQRHMHEFGTRREDLAHIALACRDRANANPAAQMHGRPLTYDDYLNAPMISSPLGLYDYCLETDGACAVVVTSAARAKSGPHPQILIRAVSQAMPEGVQGGIVMATLMRDTLTTQPSAPTAARLYERAGMTTDDIEVAQLYDCFTITVLMQLEDYGFCAKGEGGAFAASGALQLGGRLPINTAGGNLSEGYIHGMNHVVEGVRQLRGQSTSPVPDASTCLVTSGIPVSTSAMILRRAA